MAANWKEKTAIVITISSFLGVGAAYLGMFLKNDCLYWIGMFLAIPLYLGMIFLVLCFIWAVGRPRRSEETEEDSGQSEPEKSWIEAIACFFGFKAAGIFLAIPLIMLLTTPSPNDTILGDAAVFCFLSSLTMILLLGMGLSLRQYRTGQYTGINLYAQWVNVVGAMVFVLGIFFGLLELYLLKALVILSEI